MKVGSSSMMLLLGGTMVLGQNMTSGSTTTANSTGAASGGDATIGSDCSMTNKLATNQQASWSNGVVNTCCGAATGSECFIRIQSSVSATDACTIPSCGDLQSGDTAKMVGFRALTTTTSSGNTTTFIPSFGQSSASTSAIAWGVLGSAMLVAVAAAATF